MEDEPEPVNEAPYGDGWMVKIEVSGDDFEGMMDPEAYAKLVAEQS